MAALTLSQKLDLLGTRYDELTQQLSTSEVASDSSRFQKIAKQHSELEQIVAKHREYKQIEKDLAGAHQMIVEAEDPEMKQLAHEEEKQLTARKEIVERELKLLLLPKDPNDEKSVIVEIRAGTGGDEAALFAGELFRMYSRYAETQGWKVEILESSPSSLGGLKEVVAAIQGNKVYSKLKYESGVPFIPPPRPSRCFPKPTKSTSRSRRKISALTPSAPRVPAASPSTPLIPPFASRTSRADWSFHNRTKNHRSRTARRLCAFFARVFMRWSRKNSKRRLGPSAAGRSRPVTAPRKSAPITFRRTASPITASALRYTSSPT